MNHNFAIISSDKISIDYELNKIIHDINDKELEIIKLDYQDTSIDLVLEELNTYNFLANCKLIIYYNCSFLYKDSEKNLKELNKYLNNPSDNYFVMINDLLSDKKEIKELIEKVCLIKSELSTEKLIKENLKELKMDNSVINFFSNYCLKNNEKIINELNKLKCYKMDENDKNITIDDIKKVVIRDYDDDIFDLANLIVRKNKSKALELYYRILDKEKDSVNIIASISGSIRNLYSVKVLSEKRYKQNDISEILKIKPYAVSIALENCNNFSSKKLLNLLYLLSEMDIKTKSGYGQAKTLFEMFLLSL